MLPRRRHEPRRPHEARRRRRPSASSTSRGCRSTRSRSAPGGGLRIGAAVRNSDLAADRAVRERYPLLAQALLAGASGPAAQHRDDRRQPAPAHALRVLPGRLEAVQQAPARRSGCPAREGDHRNLAILGHSDACVATHPSDMAVALAAIGAEVHVTGPEGERDDPDPGPAPPARRRAAARHGARARRADHRGRAGRSRPGSPRARRYRKVRDRASFAFAVVSVAAALDVERRRGPRLPDRARRRRPRAVARRGAPRTRCAAGPRRAERFAAAAEAELAAGASRCATTPSRSRSRATCSRRP